MANGFSAKDAAAATVTIASLQANPFGLTNAQIQGYIMIDAAGANLAAVDSTGAQLVDQRPATTGTTSSVASSATVVTILASNSARRAATFYNDSTQVLYLKLGSAASTSSYAIQLPSGGYWEVPGGYNGIVTGLWASANGNARVTEIT